MSFSRRLAAALSLPLLLTGVAACGDDGGADGGGDTTTTTTADSIDGLTVTGDFGTEPTVKVDGLDVGEAETAVLIEGDGEEVAEDGSVLVQSLFAKGTDGTTLSSSFTEETPQRVEMAQTQDLISDALTGQRVGSRIAIAVPATEYFGQAPAENSGLTEEDDLVVVIDVVGVPEPPLEGPDGEAQEPPAWAPAVEESGGDVTGLDFSGSPAKPPAGLQVIPLIEGEGEEVPEGASVTVDYFGVVWKGEEPFDESYSRGEPTTFGLGQVIQGWGEGLVGVPVGSRVMLVIPAAQGYGEAGSPPDIPGGATLVFVVDVLAAEG